MWFVGLSICLSARFPRKGWLHETCIRFWADPNNFFKLPFYLIHVIFSCRAIVLTYQEHLGVTYITLNEDPCPRMLIHNKCPIPLLLKENVKGKQGTFWLHWKPLLCVLISLVVKLKIFLLHVFFPLFCFTETPRTEVYCRALPANCSLHHELYYHFSSFPECKQKEMLPTLLLKNTSDHSTTDWTDPIDINCPGTQVKE